MSDIEIIDDGKAPRVVCPNCKTVMVFDIEAFQKNGSEIMQDKCKGCNRTLYVCALIFVNLNMRSLLGNIQAIRDLYVAGKASITDQVIANRDGKLRQ